MSVEMATLATENEIIEDVELREELVNRVDVLEKVKGLLLLPAIGMATTQQVADFYEVGVEAINAIVIRHKDELLSDGYKLFKKDEVLNKLNVQDEHLEKLPSKTIVTFTNGSTLFVVNRGVRLFPKRAILRVGMLLRDSEIAKEVRAQLLNIERNTANELKVEDANLELELQRKLDKAKASGDVVEVNRLHEEILTYQSRHIATLKEKIQELQPKAEMWDDFSSSNGLITLTTFGTKFLGGISPQKVRGKLQDKGIISKQKIDGIYQPTKKYMSYFSLVPYFIGNSDSVKYTLKIKNSAVEFICNLLKEE